VICVGDGSESFVDVGGEAEIFILGPCCKKSPTCNILYNLELQLHFRSLHLEWVSE
jgi:hypothetical protein